MGLPGVFYIEVVLLFWYLVWEMNINQREWERKMEGKGRQGGYSFSWRTLPLKERIILLVTPLKNRPQSIYISRLILWALFNYIILWDFTLFHDINNSQVIKKVKKTYICDFYIQIRWYYIVTILWNFCIILYVYIDVIGLRVGVIFCLFYSIFQKYVF